MEKHLESDNTSKYIQAGNPNREYLIAGFELDLETLTLYLDQPHMEMLEIMGHTGVPESMHLLEYATRFLEESQLSSVQERIALANEQRENVDFYDRIELKLVAEDGTVRYCIVNLWFLRPGMLKGIGQNITDLKFVKEVLNDQASSLQAVIESTNDKVFLLTSHGELITYNHHFAEWMQLFFGLTISEGMDLINNFPEEKKGEWTDLMNQVGLGEKQFLEMSILKEDTFHFEIAAHPIFTHQKVSSISFFVKDVTEKWRMSAWESLENQVFEKLNRNEEISIVFDTLLLGLKKMCPEMIGYVNKKKEGELELEWLSHPSVSDNFVSKVALIPIGPLNGSCGLAAYSMQPVYISNIRNFECWNEYRDLTLLHGYQACHSFPILSRDGVILGTLGAFFRDVHELSDYELYLLNRTVNLSSVILEKYALEKDMVLKSSQLEALGYSIPGVMYIVHMDKDGNRRFEFVSERVNEYLRISKQLVLDAYENVFDVLSEADQLRFWSELKFSLENKQPLNLEFSLKPELNPEYHCFFMQSVHKFNEDGSVITYGSIYDITNQKKSELALKKKQDEMKSLIKCLDDVVYVLDENDKFIDVFADDELLVIQKKEKLIGKKFVDFFNADVCEMYLNAKIELLEKEESAEFQYPFIVNGSELNFSSRLIQVAGSTQVVFTAKNLTTEMETINVNKKLSKIVEEASSYARFGSFEFVFTTKEVFWSKSIFEMLGWPVSISSQDLYARYIESIHPDEISQFNEFMQNAYQLGSGFEYDHRVRHNDGHFLWFKSKVKVEKDPAGNPISLQGITFDITNQKFSDVLLERKTSLLEAIALLSSELFTVAEIENAINVILPKIGLASHVNRVHVYRNHMDAKSGKLMTTRILHWEDGLFPLPVTEELLTNASYEKLGLKRWIEVLGKGESIVGDVSSFPLEEQKVLLDQNVVTMVVVPIFVGDYWWGFMGFDECRGTRKWASGVVELLQTISKLVGAAFSRQKDHKSLLEYKERYQTAFEITDEAIVITDSLGVHLTSNVAAQRMLGIKEAEQVGVCAQLKLNGNLLIHEDGTEFLEEEYPINIVTRDKKAVKHVKMGIKKVDGQLKWLSINVAPLYSFNNPDPTGLMIMMSDMDELIQLKKEHSIATAKVLSLEKMIPQEIANSLELTTQLLQVQKQFLGDPGLHWVMEESIKRISTLKHVHVHLLQEREQEVLSVASFFESVVYRLKEDGIKIGVAIHADVQCASIGLPVSLSLPFCLLVNELVLNCSRHAFSNRLTGDVSIHFKKQGEYFVLEISDDGIGLPANFKWEKSTTFGFQFIQKLLSQLKGAATVTSEKGCKIMVTFPG